jgi:isopenicillin N synthase-like dioxygenase
VELAASNDYVLVETTLYNAFFVVKDQYDQYLAEEVPDTSIEALHECTMGTSIYQLYDGSLKLWGCKKLLWHRLPIEESKLQMLPESRRGFPFAPVVTEDMPFAGSRAIDLTPYFQPELHPTASNESRRKSAADLFEQLQKDGFCLVRGTGINRAVCQRALDATNAFLHDADESVRRSCMTIDRARRGYCPMNVENFASLIGERGPNDLVRKFRMGPILQSKDHSAATRSALLQPNVWPSSESWDGSASFQSAIEEYYEVACAAAQRVVRAIGDGLLLVHPELESSIQPIMTTNGFSDQTTSILTLLGYRTGTRHKGKNKGPLVAAHTDVGVITMLLFDGAKTCATLQRSNGMGKWIDVELPHSVPVDPIFVVNVADCFAELSQGLVPSTLHRVVAWRESTVPRNCCALFVGLDPRAQLTIGNEVISYEEWRKRRIAKAQSVLQLR